MPTWRGWPRRWTRWRSAGCSWTSWRGPRPTRPSWRCCGGPWRRPSMTRRPPDAAAHPRAAGVRPLRHWAADRLRPAGRQRPVPARRAHRGGQEHDPGRDHVRALRRAGRGRVRRGPAPVPLRRPGRGAQGHAGVLPPRHPLPGDPDARAPAAQEARRGLHHRGQPRPPGAAGGGRLAQPDLEQGRGGRGGHRGGRAQPRAVHPGHAAAAGGVRPVPAGPGRRPAGPAHQAVRHPAV